MFDMPERIAAEHRAGGIADGKVGAARCLEIEFPLPAAERRPASSSLSIADPGGRDHAVQIQSRRAGGKD